MDSHHLTQFNIAFVACAEDPEPTLATDACHITIWRIEVSEQDHLRLGDPLSMFTDAATTNLRSVSLHGLTVAYAIEARPWYCVVIVDWKEADGKEKSEFFVRQYVTPLHCNGTFLPNNRVCLLTLMIPQKVKLLPGQRLLATEATDDVEVWNWGQDCRISKLDAFHQKKRRKVAPIWSHRHAGARYRFDSGKLQHESLGDPIVLDGAVKAVIPYRGAALGITVPMDNYSGDAIQGRMLIESWFGTQGTDKFFGHRQAVGTTDTCQFMMACHYPWPDESPNAPETSPRLHFAEWNVPRSTMVGPTRVLYDQYSQRVVAVDRALSHFLTFGNTHSRTETATTLSDM